MKLYIIKSAFLNNYIRLYFYYTELVYADR